MLAALLGIEQCCEAVTVCCCWPTGSLQVAIRQDLREVLCRLEPELRSSWTCSPPTGREDAARGAAAETDPKQIRSVQAIETAKYKNSGASTAGALLTEHTGRDKNIHVSKLLAANKSLPLGPAEAAREPGADGDSRTADGEEGCSWIENIKWMRPGRDVGDRILPSDSTPSPPLAVSSPEHEASLTPFSATGSAFNNGPTKKPASASSGGRLSDNELSRPRTGSGPFKSLSATPLFIHPSNGRTETSGDQATELSWEMRQRLLQQPPASVTVAASITSQGLLNEGKCGGLEPSRVFEMPISRHISEASRWFQT